MAGGRIAGITIEIGGDTTGLDKALKGVNAQLGSTQRSLNDVNKLLKLDPSNVDLLKQKQDYLTKAIESTKEKLATEQEALKQMKASSTTDDVTEEQKALEREIVATQGKLQALQTQYTEFGSVGAQQIQQVGEKMKGIGSSVTGAGVKITKGVTVPIAAAGAASVAAWKEVDGAMDTIVKKTGASGKPLEDMQKAAKNIATTIPTSFDTAAEAVGEVNTRFGATGTELETLSTKFVQFAELNDKDVTSSVDSVQKAMAAMNLDLDDADDLLDTLNAAAQASGIDVDTLTSSIVANAAAFDGMGLSTGDVIALLAKVEKSGVGVDAVMAGLKKAMAKAAKEGKPTSKALSDVEASIRGAGSETEATRLAMELFGNKAGPAIAKAVRDGQLSFEAMGTSLTDYAGSVEDTFNTTLDPLDKVDTLMNQLKVTGASIVDTSAPAIESALETVSKVVKDLADKWMSLDSGTQEMIIKFALAAAAVGPLVSGFGGMISMAGGVTTGVGKIVGKIAGSGGLMSAIGSAGGGAGLIGSIGSLVTAAGPILAGGAIVAGVVAGGVLIYKNWDKIKEGAKKLADGIKKGWEGIKKNTSAAFESVKKTVSEKWNAVSTSVKTKAGEIATTAKTKFNELKNNAATIIGGMATTVKEKFTALKTNVTTIAGGVASTVKEKFNTLKTNVGTIAGNIATTAKEKFNTLKTNLTTVTGNIATSVKEKFGTLKTNVTTIAGNVATAVKNKWNGLKDNATSTFEKLASNAKSKFDAMKTNLVTAATNIASGIKTKLSEAASAAKTSLGAIATAAKDKAASAINTAKTRLGELASGLKSISANTFVTVASNVAKTAKDKFATAVSSAKNLVNDMTTKLNGFSASGFIGALSKAGTALKDNVADKLSGVWSTLSSIKNNFSSFKISFPQIKLPHFELQTGQVTILGRTFKYPKGFNVRWYKKAYENPVMFTSPTVLQTPYGPKGFGDGAGGEIVLSDKKLREIAGSGTTTYTVNVYGASGQDVNALADAVQRRLVALQRQKEAAGVA